MAAVWTRTYVRIRLGRRTGGVSTTDFGTREFATLDRDGNLIRFFRWEEA
jgi:hypothetical protein